MSLKFEKLMKKFTPDERVQTVLDINDSVFKELINKVLIDHREEIGEDGADKITEILNNQNSTEEERVNLCITFIEEKLTKDKVDSLINTAVEEEKDTYDFLLEK